MFQFRRKLWFRGTSYPISCSWDRPPRHLRKPQWRLKTRNPKVLNVCQSYINKPFRNTAGHNWLGLGNTQNCKADRASHSFYKGDNYYLGRHQWLDSLNSRTSQLFEKEKGLYWKISDDTQKHLKQLHEYQRKLFQQMMVQEDPEKKWTSTSRDETKPNATQESVVDDSKLGFDTPEQSKTPYSAEATEFSEPLEQSTKKDKTFAESPESPSASSLNTKAISDIPPTNPSETAGSAGLQGQYRASAAKVQKMVDTLPGRVNFRDYKPKPLPKQGNSGRKITKGRVIAIQDLNLESLTPSEIRERYVTENTAPNTPIEQTVTPMISSEPTETKSTFHISESIGNIQKDGIDSKLESQSQSTTVNQDSSDKSKAAPFEEQSNHQKEATAAPVNEAYSIPQSETRRSCHHNRHRHRAQQSFLTEYIILTPTQNIIKTNHMPLKDKQLLQDTFSILSQLSRPEKYRKSIAKLEKKGWKIIGGGGQGDLIVFERTIKVRTGRRKVKFILLGLSLATVGTLVAGGLAFPAML